MGGGKQPKDEVKGVSVRLHPKPQKHQEYAGDCDTTNPHDPDEFIVEGGRLTSGEKLHRQREDQIQTCKAVEKTLQVAEKRLKGMERDSSTSCYATNIEVAKDRLRSAQKAMALSQGGRNSQEVKTAFTTIEFFNDVAACKTGNSDPVSSTQPDSSSHPVLPINQIGFSMLGDPDRQPIESHIIIAGAHYVHLKGDGILYSIPDYAELPWTTRAIFPLAE